MLNKIIGRNKMSTKQLSQLAADIDRAWLSYEPTYGAPDNVAELFDSLAKLSAGDALQEVLKRMNDAKPGDIKHRLGALGVACGTLTKNRCIPNDVYSTWRSDMPIILAGTEVLARTSGPYEYANAVARLIYLEDNRKISDMAQQLAPFLVIVAPAPDELQ